MQDVLRKLAWWIRSSTGRVLPEGDAKPEPSPGPAPRTRLEIAANDDPGRPQALRFSWPPKLDRPRMVRYAKDAAALLVTADTFLVASKKFFGPALGYDEQFFVWGGWSILKGLVPYKDFLEHKPPMVFVTHAIAIALFGFENNQYRHFFILFSLMAILAWQLALQSRGVRPLISLAITFSLIYLFTSWSYHDTSLTDSESIGFDYYFLGAACLVAKTRYRRLFDIAGGIFLSFCVLSKEPFIPCVGATWIACYLVRDRLEGGRRSALFYVRDTATGIGLVLFACLAYMIPTGSLRHYLAMLQRYQVMFRDPNLGYCAVLGIFKPQGLLVDIPRQWAIIHGVFYNEATLSFLAPLALAAAVFTGWRSKTLLVASFLALLGAMYAVTISNCYWAHYYVMAQTGLMFFLSIGAICLSERFARWPAPVRVFTYLVVLLPILNHVWPSLETEAKSHYPSQAPIEPVPGVFAFIAENTVPTDRIFTTGPPGLYMITDRIGATTTSSVTDEIIASFPGRTDAEKLRPCYDDLVKHRPKVVVLDPEHGDRKRRYLAAAILPFLEDFHYRQVNQYIYVRPQ